MLLFVINLVLTTFVLFIISALIPGFEINHTGPAIFSCFLIGFVNFLIRPFLGLTTLPRTLLTLSLITFILNALMLNVAYVLTQGLGERSWQVVIFGAILLTILQLLINMATQRKSRFVH